jgi:hypothetical protein
MHWACSALPQGHLYVDIQLIQRAVARNLNGFFIRCPMGSTANAQRGQQLVTRSGNLDVHCSKKEKIELPAGFSMQASISQA